MTEELFRQDSYLRRCDAKVIAITGNRIELDRTVFYPTGGGQPGDTGILRTADGTEIAITDTQKDGQNIHHICETEELTLKVNDSVIAELNWERRYLYMRVHTALHLLCAHVEGAVTGGSIGLGKGRLDFNIPENRPDKELLTSKLANDVEADYSLTTCWITDEELSLNPEMVRTMSVKPPQGEGKIRMIRIGDSIDFQPCGGTHLRSTREIGAIMVGKIENKGRQNRRINIILNDQK